MSDFREARIQAGNLKLHYLEWGSAQKTAKRPLYACTERRCRRVP